MLLRLAYLTVTNALAVLRLLPISDRDKDVEILALRHQLAVLQREIGPQTVTFTPADRAILAALLQPLPRSVLRRLRLIVRPDTVLRWHRNLMRQRHANISKRKLHETSLTLRIMHANPNARPRPLLNPPVSSWARMVLRACSGARGNPGVLRSAQQRR